jgi:hypothetical protein
MLTCHVHSIRYHLYDVATTDKGGGIDFVDLDSGSGSVFDPDQATQTATGEWGICVDVDSSMNQGCPDQTMSAVMDGIVGCFDRRFSIFLCGLEVDIKGGDTSTASIEGQNFLYAGAGRVLVAAGRDSDGDGIVTPAVTCSDPIDCNQVRASARRPVSGGPSTHTHNNASMAN